jgi:transmembrane 9 superfamily protein 3
LCISDIKVDCCFVAGIVGESEENGGSVSHYIWTHKKFDIGYNGQQIVDVNLTSENKVRLDLNIKIPFTYEVNWRRSGIKYEDRFDKYLDPNFFQHRVSLIFSTFLFHLYREFSFLLDYVHLSYYLLRTIYQVKFCIA